MERIYCLGTWCLYPFPLPVLVCKLFRAETLFALTFLQHVTNGALILAEVLGTTIKQINAFFFFFLSFPVRCCHTQRNQAQSFVLFHEFLCKIVMFSRIDLNTTHCINSLILNRAERCPSHFEKASVAFDFTDLCTSL